MNSSRSDKVCEYFRPNIKEWDEDKVCQIFHETDVNCILQVRIPQSIVHDRVAWMARSEGKYTAKSGYHFWYNGQYNLNSNTLSKG